MRKHAGLICAGLAILLAGCEAASQTSSCPLPGQARMMSLKLYFGRDIPGGGFVTDEAWSSFAASILTPAFPDGFTAYEATGQWRNPQDGTIAREKSFVVETVGITAPAPIATVIQAYRTTFHQIAVGEVTQPVCAAF